MGMTKVKDEGRRKIAKSFSIQTSVIENFTSICEQRDLVPSHVVEELMEKFSNGEVKLYADPNGV